MNQVLQILRDNWLLLAVIAAFAGAFVFLRSPATPVATLEALDAELADGQPKIVEFYSDF
jgi:hypothetical protein